MTRALAACFDVIVVVAVSALPEGLGFVAGLDAWLISMAVTAALLHGVPEALVGRSPGKAVTSLRVVAGDGGRLGWVGAGTRWAARWGPVLLTGLLTLPLWVPPVAWLLLIVPSPFDARGRALHDRLAGSIVTDAPASALLRRGAQPRGVAIFSGRGAGSLLGRRRP